MAEDRYVGEFPRLDTVNQKYLDSILSPAAFNALVASERSFTDLFTILHQKFQDLRIFNMAADGTVELIKKEHHQIHHGIYYEVIQKWMLHNQHVVVEGISDIDELANMSICFQWNQSGKLAGYTLYTRITDPDNIGESIFLAFFHAGMRRVVMLIISGLEQRLAASRFISKHGVIIPFDKSCGWCGRVDENLKKCMCKTARYCNAECQLKHWNMHKNGCSMRKSK